MFQALTYFSSASRAFMIVGYIWFSAPYLSIDWLSKD